MKLEMLFEVLFEAGLLSMDVELIDVNGGVEVVSQKCIKENGVDQQTLVLGWALIRWVANEKKLDELGPVRFMHPATSYGLMFHQNNEYGHKELVAP